jgi:hypothetical protein
MRLRLDNAINGATAVSSGGVIGLLYQELTTATGIPRWRTVLKRSRDAVNWSDVVLADVPVNAAPKRFDPYLGDYDHPVDAGRVFCRCVFDGQHTRFRKFPERGHLPTQRRFYLAQAVSPRRSDRGAPVDRSILLSHSRSVSTERAVAADS